MRSPPGIGEECLQACLQDQYDLIPAVLEFLPLGHDYDAGVYHVVSVQGRAYLLKATSRLLYEPACLVPAYLRAQGITSIVAPVPTRSGALWTQFGEWTVILYPWIGGEFSLTGMTNAQWKEVRALSSAFTGSGCPLWALSHCTRSALIRRSTPDGFIPLRHNTYRMEQYRCRTARSSLLLEGHQPTIHAAVTRLQKLAEMLQSRAFSYVICHADLHARNLIRDQAGHVFVIDWDEASSHLAI